MKRTFVVSMIRKIYFYLIWVCLVLLTSACSERRIVIGVSQCSNDIWRQKVNREIKIGQYQYRNVDVVITSADNDAERQVRQIDSLIKEKVDLLVVAPSDAKTVTASVERAFRAGIPVVLYDRKIDSPHYTAYIGADNVEIGRTVARYMVGQLDGKGTIVEITGEKGASPVAERHRGFMEVMKKCPSIKVVTLYGDWNVDGAKALMADCLAKVGHVDGVFGHNDAEALGAVMAAKEKGVDKDMVVVGIDGLPGEKQGIQLVEKGDFSASYIYPTKGEYIVPLAMKILQGKPYLRINNLPSCLVTADNAELIDMQSKEVEEQTANLDNIYASINSYMRMYQSQKLISILSVVVVVLLLVLMVYIYIMYQTKTRIGKQKKQMAEEKVKFFTNVSHQLRTPLTLVSGPLHMLMEKGKFEGEQLKLLQIVSRNIAELESLTENALNFKEKVEAMDKKEDTMVSDENVSRIVLKESRHDRLVNEAEDEELATILVVDDNADIRSYLHSLLSENYYVIEASDGQNGLRLAYEAVPDLIVSDVMMPIMDGLTFCSKIKEDEVTSHIPVILLTARSDEQQRAEGYEHGADAYITKPFNAHLLMARISNLLKARRSRMTQSATSMETGKDEKMELEEGERLFLDKFKKKVLERMGDANLKMDDLGAEMELSKVQMYRKVKALTGKTPAEVLREMRLRKAYMLLKQTDKTIADVSAEVGFAFPSYFSACFKKQFGINPTDMRVE